MPSFIEHQYVGDSYITETYSGQNLRVCSRLAASSITTPYEIGYSPIYGNICTSCTSSSSYDSGLECYDQQIITLSIIISVGSVTRNYYQDYPPDVIQMYEACNLQPPISYRGYETEEAQSLYTFKLSCEGEKTAKLLQIEAYAIMISEMQPSGAEFLINGVPPLYIQQSYVGYSEYLRLYG
ncbi:MAG: hypothetical protein AB1480_13485 [Nitrospirota bacterium]